LPALKPLPVLLNPVLYFNLTTQWPYAHRIEYHYTAEIMGSIFVSLIEAIAFIAMVCAKCRIRRAYAYCGILALLATSVVATNKRDQEYLRFSNITVPGPRTDRVLIEEMLSLKEKLKHKDVSVHYRLLPFFADRDVCYRWPNPLSRYDYGTGASVRIDRWPEYILLERPYLTSDDVSLLDEHGYVEDSRTNTLVLYRATRRDSAGRAESLYDAAVLGDTQLSNEVLAGFIAGGVSNRIIYVDGRCGAIPGGAKQLLSGAGRVRSHSGDFFVNRDQLFQSGLLVMQYAVGRPEPTEAEYEIIRRYVANGGRLLLMCPAWVWPAYDKKPLEQLPYRRIAAQFGLIVETEYAKPPLKTGLPPFKADGVGDILQLQGTYSVIGYPPGSGATPILVGSDGKAAAVAAELGKARIIVWGQDNLLSAEAAGRPGAMEFAGQAVQWLLSEAQNGGGIDASAEKPRPAEEPR
jgi:hypothetical protein